MIGAMAAVFAVVSSVDPAMPVTVSGC